MLRQIAFVLLLSAIPATLAKVAGLANNGKVVELKSGTQVDWYNCTAQGNYPDPTTCDHYIACTTALLAYQMPCPLNHDGRLLWYVRDSGPSEKESHCDYPKKVECNLDVSDDPVTPEPTVAHTEDPAPEPTEDPTPEPTDAPEGPHSKCKDINAIEGNPCDPSVDCKECGYCDWFLRCDEDQQKWVKEQCAFKTESDGETILVANKTFWNPAVTTHGGQCNFYDLLSPLVQKDYSVDPECKPVCGYWGDKDCDRVYYYVDPDLSEGIWRAKPQTFSCPKGLVWHQDLSCTFCPENATCNANCPID